MNFLLINVQGRVGFYSRKRASITMAPPIAPPLGLLYIAEVLINNGYDVSIFDHGATNYNFIQVLSWIKNKNPDVLGISVLTRSFLSGIKIAKLAKDWNPNIKIILGNYHTICAERILNKYSFIDFCIITLENLWIEFTRISLLPMTNITSPLFTNFCALRYILVYICTPSGSSVARL